MKDENNQKLRDSMIKYLYTERKMFITDIAKTIGIRRSTVTKTLNDSGIDTSKKSRIRDKMRLGFHLHHRVKLPFLESARLAKISSGSLRGYFNEKGVAIRPASYEAMSKEKKELYWVMWNNDKAYQPSNLFAIPNNLQSLISNKMADSVITLYEGGISIKEISDKNLVPLGTSTMRKLLTHNGIQIRQGEEYTRLYDVNENYFDVIDSENKAYWLGFLMGDGCVSGDEGKNNWILSVALQRRDKPHLEMLLDSLDSDYRISEYLVSGRYATCSIAIASTHLCKSLESLGVVRRKSLVAQLPKGVNDALMSHFIRGLFDADGSIPRSNGRVMGISICGTLELMESILGILQMEDKYLYVRKDLRNFAEIRCHKGAEAKRVLDIIYKDATIYMDRKYNRYIELCKKVEQM